MTSIRMRRGNKADMPISAPSGMPLWCEDTKEMFVGTGSAVEKIGNPAGSIIWIAKSFAPEGYIKCNGAELSRVIYAELFTAIGETFGNGDGSATFNIPDLRGEFIRGCDDDRGVDINRIIGSWQSHQIENHKHRPADTICQSMSMPHQSSSIYAMTTGPGATINNAYNTSDPVSGNYGNETRPRNIALLACIKY